jgi:hypothetical protein
VTYATGGVGGYYKTTTPGVVGTAGAPNTGNGGGGGNGSGTLSWDGGGGGSGIVIIRYSNTFANAVTLTGAPTYNNSGGYKSYTFTSSGSIVW